MVVLADFCEKRVERLRNVLHLYFSTYRYILAKIDIWRKSTQKFTENGKVLAYVASVSVRFRSKERGTRVKDCAKNGAGKRTLVSFLARPKPRIPFLGLSLHRNQTETLATQANKLLFA